MAITVTQLTSGSDATDKALGAAYSTASVSPASNSLILLAVATNVYSGATAAPTASGNGLTYVQIDTQAYGPSALVNRVTLFRAMGASPSSGAITITSGDVLTKTGNWSVLQVDGIDTSGTNGSGAIVQSAKNSTDGGNPDTLTVTLAALGDAANNAVVVVFGNDVGTAGTMSVSTYTETCDISAGQDDGLAAYYKIPGTTTPQGACSSAFADLGGIAVEIKAAAAGAGTKPKTLLLLGVGNG